MRQAEVCHQSLTNSTRIALTFEDIGILPLLNHEPLDSFIELWKLENEFDFERYEISSAIYEEVENYNTFYRFAAKIVDESIKPEPVVTKIVNKRFWDLI